MGRRISGRARPDAATSPGRRGHRAQPPRERTSQAPLCRRPSTVRLIPLLTDDPAAGLLDPKPTPEALCAEPSAAKEETSGGAAPPARHPALRRSPPRDRPGTRSSAVGLDGSPLPGHRSTMSTAHHV